MPTVEVEFQLRGGNDLAWSCTDGQILVEGPRGTGKTRTILERLNAYCQKYAGIKILMVRKWQRSLAGSSVQTLRHQVLKNGDGVSYFGGNEVEPASFRYKNGSALVLGGLDDTDKFKSTEYHQIYFNEATEGTEDDWDDLRALLRQNIDIPVRRRIIGDCNPVDRGHWLNRRCESGEITRIVTRLEDNPYYFDDDGNPTKEGEEYLGILDSYKGSRYQRWRLGLWTGTENGCYEAFDRSVHIRPIEPGTYFKTTIIGEDYGSVHLCAVAVISIDQRNRRWVREVWAGSDEEGSDGRPSKVDEVVRQFRVKYSATRGRVDPNQAKLAKLHGFNVAKGGSGGRQGNPRLKRVDDLKVLFYNYEGGVVPTKSQVASNNVPRGPFPDPDSPGLLMVEGAPGIEELAAEIDSYHYIYIDTDRGRMKDIYRVNDDRIAAVEYANEEWEETGNTSYPTSVPQLGRAAAPPVTNSLLSRRKKDSFREWRLH